MINDKTVTKCNDKNCGACPLITKTNTIVFKYGKIPFNIKSNMNCNAENVIYLISCSGLDTLKNTLNKLLFYEPGFEFINSKS